jgi:hypothetical protein
MRRRIADDFGHDLLDQRPVTALEEVIGDEILCPVHGLAEWNAEFLELLGVHELVFRFQLNRQALAALD